MDALDTPGPRYAVLVVDGPVTMTEGCHLRLGECTRESAADEAMLEIVEAVGSAHDTAAVGTFVIGMPGEEYVGDLVPDTLCSIIRDTLMAAPWNQLIWLAGCAEG